jgi:hypothetical protein
MKSSFKKVDVNKYLDFEKISMDLVNMCGSKKVFELDV